jgi:uncharacterized protein (DUF885 family)
MKFIASRLARIASVLTLVTTAAAQTLPAEPVASQPEPAGGGGGTGRGGGVPADLKPLLVTGRNEMRLVTEHYTSDRGLLSRFHEIPRNRNLTGGGGGGGGGGRGGAGGGRSGDGGAGAGRGGDAEAATQDGTGRGGADLSPLAPPEPQAGGGGGRGGRGAAGGGTAAEGNSPSMSYTHIAKMKRFDADWAAALEKIDASKLSAPAQADLQALKSRIAANARAIDAQAANQKLIEPLLPFAQAVVGLEEARRRMESMDAEKAAIALLKVSRQVAEFQRSLEAGINDPTKMPSLRFSKATVARAAYVVDGLQATLRDWFAFYNDYDPMFTWWIPQQHKETDAALAAYANFLRNQLAAAAPDELPAGPAPEPVAMAAAPAWDQVPDLQGLLAYPHNELVTIEQRFGNVGGGAGRGGRGGRTPQVAAEWLAALKTLDFDNLSRNAQVDYLRMRNSLDVTIKRANTPPQQNIPRKEPNERLNGQALIAPVGRQALQFGLDEEMIPYTPEELLQLAEVEFKWCDDEARAASIALGQGGDLHNAMEIAKANHMPAGKQPDMIRDLMREAVTFMRQKELITVPLIDYETLQMEMMSAQRQLVNPYFTGGALISVSYPVTSMTTQQRLESMRGNNFNFARATVHHELIPGHNMVAYMGPRFSPLRGGSLGSTPFYNEGWAVYWEIRFYDLGYARTPEEKLGFLFWRMMRCARIVFSLNYHLGNWSGKECVDYLVSRIDSERENAAAEVTRSFNGSYPPLYQAGYLLGALQFRSLHGELVKSGKMTEMQFHDGIMRQPQMPVPLMKLAVSKDKLSADMPLGWKFYGDLSQK